jgi:hypothetical protein
MRPVVPKNYDYEFMALGMCGSTQGMEDGTITTT